MICHGMKLTYLYYVTQEQEDDEHKNTFTSIFDREDLNEDRRFVNRLWGQHSVDDEDVITKRIDAMIQKISISENDTARLQWAKVQHFDLTRQWQRLQGRLLNTLYDFGDNNGPAFFTVLSQISYFPSNHVASIIGLIHSLPVIGWQLVAANSLELTPTIFGFGVSQDGQLP